MFNDDWWVTYTHPSDHTLRTEDLSSMMAEDLGYGMRYNICSETPLEFRRGQFGYAETPPFDVSATGGTCSDHNECMALV